MKAIVGVDAGNLYLPALDLLARLNCARPEVDFVHISEHRQILPGIGSFRNGSADPADDQRRRQDGRALLDGALRDGERHHLPCHATQLEGNSPRRLIEYADSTHADLIAVGAHAKTNEHGILRGSVGRGLVTGARQSVLLAKRFLDRQGPLKVVFGTDHSPYASACARLLVAWQPQGIGQLVVVTATGEPRHPDDILASIRTDVEEEVRSRSTALVKHLNAVGIPSEYRLISGDVQQALEATADLVDADLVVIGARGHGFLERLLIGSTSLQVALTLPQNLLILRPKA